MRMDPRGPKVSTPGGGEFNADTNSSRRQWVRNHAEPEEPTYHLLACSGAVLVQAKWTKEAAVDPGGMDSRVCVWVSGMCEGVRVGVSRVDVKVWMWRIRGVSKCQEGSQGFGVLGVCEGVLWVAVLWGGVRGVTSSGRGVCGSQSWGVRGVGVSRVCGGLRAGGDRGGGGRAGWQEVSEGFGVAGVICDGEHDRRQCQ